MSLRAALAGSFSPRHLARGVSLLLECMIGLGLFALGILFTLSLFPTAANSLSQAREVGQASALAREVMETQLTSGYNAVASQPPVPWNLTSTDRGVNVTQQFMYQIDVTNPTGTVDYKGVNVSVFWSHGNANRTVEIQDCRRNT